MPETLRRGSNGGSVREAQRKLNAAGFRVGLVNGNFGPRMEAEVRRFQAAKHASEANGIIGEQTWRLLNSAAGTTN